MASKKSDSTDLHVKRLRRTCITLAVLAVLSLVVFVLANRFKGRPPAGLASTGIEPKSDVNPLPSEKRGEINMESESEYYSAPETQEEAKNVLFYNGFTIRRVRDAISIYKTDQTGEELICELCAYNPEDFNLTDLAALLKARGEYHRKVAESLPTVSLPEDDLFQAYADYFLTKSYYWTDIPNYHQKIKAKDLTTILKITKNQTVEIFGKTDNIKVKDTMPDGNCAYYSLILALFDELKDPKCDLFNRVFNLSFILDRKFSDQTGGRGHVFEQSTPLKCYAKTCKLDYFRLTALLSILESDSSNNLSKFQLFEIVFYLKALIYIEFNINGDLQPMVIDTDNSMEFRNLMVSHHECIYDVCFAALNSIFKKDFCILRVDKPLSGRLTLENIVRFDAGENESTIYLLFLKDNHYMLILPQE